LLLFYKKEVLFFFRKKEPKNFCPAIIAPDTPHHVIVQPSAPTVVSDGPDRSQADIDALLA